MNRDVNEFIQMLVNAGQRFLEQKDRQASAPMYQGPAAQPPKPSATPSQDMAQQAAQASQLPARQPGKFELPASATPTAQRTDKLPVTPMDSQSQAKVMQLLRDVVMKLETIGSRLQKVEEHVGIKTEFEKRELIEQAGPPEAAVDEVH